MNFPKPVLNDDIKAIHSVQTALLNKLDFDSRHGTRITILSQEDRDKITDKQNIGALLIVSDKNDVGNFKLNVSLPDADGNLVWKEISLV